MTGKGTVGYQGEKLFGSLLLIMMEEQQAKQLEAQKKAPDKAAAKPASATKGRKAKKAKYVVFGEGNLDFAFTPWLTGTANVILDPKGHITIIGKIEPQKEFKLFEPKDYNKEFFKLEPRISYGIRPILSIGIFGSLSVGAFAKLEGKLYKIAVEGTYSTDPEKSKDFSIRGTLNISAAAGLKVRGELGAVLEILGHDVKAGAGLDCIAGVRGYAEATPVIGYREKKAAEAEDKKGEFFIRGDVEVAAQAFLALRGDLFVEVDAPWWSPVPDKKWTWPLGSKEYPLGRSFGLKASVDYVFGSGQWPAVELQPVEFSADKFVSDLYADKAKGKSGEKKAPGAWKEKNSKDAAPPPKEGNKGTAERGKSPKQPPAQPTVKPGGPKKKVKPAPDNAVTAEGKKVKEYKKEAAKKGKPAPKEPKKGTAKETKTPKTGAQDAKTKAAMDVSAAKRTVKDPLKTQLPNGASQVAEVNKVLSGVASKAKPALTKLQATEVMQGKPKNEGAIGFKVAARDPKGKSVPIAAVRYSKAGTALSHKERWKIGVEGVKKAVSKLEKQGLSAEAIRMQFPKWQSEFGFRTLRLNTDQMPWVIEGEMSPGEEVMKFSPRGIPDGSEGHPYWIKWHKRPIQNYPPVRVRPEPGAKFIRVEPTQRLTVTVLIPDEQAEAQLSKLKFTLGILNSELQKRKVLRNSS